MSTYSNNTTIKIKDAVQSTVSTASTTTMQSTSVSAASTEYCEVQISVGNNSGSNVTVGIGWQGNTMSAINDDMLYYGAVPTGAVTPIGTFRIPPGKTIYWANSSGSTTNCKLYISGVRYLNTP